MGEIERIDLFPFVLALVSNLKSRLPRTPNNGTAPVANGQSLQPPPTLFGVRGRDPRAICKGEK